MEITKLENGRYIIEHDGLMVAEDSLEEAIKTYGEGMYERGYQAHRKGQP